MCVKDKCLYMAGNRSNTIVRVDLEKAYRCMIDSQNPDDAITTGSLINKKNNPNLVNITNVQIIPVHSGILVSTSNKIYLIDDYLQVTSEYSVTNVIQVIKFEQEGREFLAVLQSHNYLTLISIFMGRLYEVNHLMIIEKSYTLFYGVVYIEANSCLMVYGPQNYQNWFAIDFSQHDLAH